MKRMLERLGFDKRTMMRFLLVILNSQLIYAFTAIRSVLYDPFLEALGVTNTQFGVLMGFIGFITVWRSGGFRIGFLFGKYWRLIRLCMAAGRWSCPCGRDVRMR